MARVENESGGAPTATLRATSGANPAAQPATNASATRPRSRGSARNRWTAQSATKGPKRSADSRASTASVNSIPATSQRATESPERTRHQRRRSEVVTASESRRRNGSCRRNGP